jgi:hypothetical protein
LLRGLATPLLAPGVRNEVAGTNPSNYWANYVELVPVRSAAGSPVAINKLRFRARFLRRVYGGHGYGRSIGSGTSQSFTVYGRVPAQTTPASGIFTLPEPRPTLAGHVRGP